MEVVCAGFAIRPASLPKFDGDVRHFLAKGEMNRSLGAGYLIQQQHDWRLITKEK
jgi:hypothetical protein